MMKTPNSSVDRRSTESFSTESCLNKARLAESAYPKAAPASRQAVGANVSPVLPPETIAANIANVRRQITAAAIAAQRDKNEIKLMLAAKYQPIENLRAAIAAGEALFGHNLVQHLEWSEPQISEHSHRSTMIGHIQSNKLSTAMEFAARIDTVDSLKMAQRIARRHRARIESGSSPDIPYPILLQVNSAGADSQFGCAPQELIELAKRILELPEVKIEGLMTIGANTPDKTAVIRSFEITRELSGQLRQLPSLSGASELSMGMTADLELAIAHGSTLVRIGTAVFGARRQK